MIRTSNEEIDETEDETSESDFNWDELISNPEDYNISSDSSKKQFEINSSEPDLSEDFMSQLNALNFSDKELESAEYIIGNLDDRGYLAIEPIVISDKMGLSEQKILSLIDEIKKLDPPGIGSRNLQECLLLQLATYPKDTQWLTEAQMLLSDHIALLGNRDYRQLMRETKLKEADLKAVMALIHSLDPRPGNRVIHSDTEYVVPDVSVFKDHGKWVVTINPDSVPRIKVNEQYAALSKNTRNSADSQFIRTHLQDAKWLIKSLESRNETLLKVARCIVEHQQDFFEYGEEAMKPMVLNDIALAVEMHESTISRVTTQKYMHTPRGIFELKYFFSSHVSTDNGGECSSTAIRALVKKLVAAENQAKPLSDSKIATLLAEQGIMVARRTIAKYRESLGIPPSNQRKRLI